MSFLTPEEFAASTAEKEAATRRAYTWHAASKDLALSTPLTLPEADEVVRLIEPTGVHPYDVLLCLRAIFRSIGAERSQRSRDVALSLACLINLGKEIGP